MKKYFIYFLFLAAGLAYFACTKEQQTLQSSESAGLAEIQQVRETIRKDLLEVQKAQGLSSNLSTRGSGAFIVVPAGSSDAMTAAMNSVGAGGVVYLKAGTHTESSGLTITTPVIIIGENGAVLKVKAPLNGTDASGTKLLSPAIYVKSAPQTAVLNVDLQPVDSSGGVGILFENSAQSAVLYNKMTGFVYGVIIQNSDQVVAISNHIIGAALTGTEIIGILNVNGNSTYIANNEVESVGTGVFISGKYGNIVYNNLHNNVIGINLCSYIGILKSPGGTNTFTGLYHAESWKVNNNTTTNNKVDGIAVVSESLLNVIQANIGSGNGTYDVDMAGESHRFAGGILTHMSHNNTLVTTAGQKINNCGSNNSITGATSLDHNCN